MPRIVERRIYNGALERIQRLGLSSLWQEIETTVTTFRLLITEERDANGGAAVRDLLDSAFLKAGGWKNLVSGGIDWTKCKTVNGTQICIGVEIQFSGRSDLLIVDVAHLRDKIIAGAIDIGVMI